MYGSMISLCFTFVFILVVATVGLSLEKKIVRTPKKKIDLRKSHVLFRWNRFDTLTIVFAGYAFLCTACLFFLLTAKKDFTDSYVQFFSNQAFTWVLVSFIYFISRVSLLLKGIKERWPDDIH
jgi:hypothetical protein